MSNLVLSYDDIERISLAYILEDETWPKFVEWVKGHVASLQAGEWIATSPSKHELRREWMLHSSSALIRASADFVPADDDQKPE